MDDLVLPPALHAVALGQLGVFTREQAAAHGVDGRELDRRRRAGQLVVLRRGVYVRRQDAVADERDPHGHLLAAVARRLSLTGDLVVSHLSAACLLRYRLLDGPPPEPQLTLARPAGAPAAHVRGLFAAHVPAADRRALGPALVVTSPARTVADCCRLLGRDAAVVLADSALAAGVPRAEVVEVLDRCARWRGAVAARQVVLFADGRAESALESLARQWFLERGLPAPDLQSRLVASATGRLLGRVDFHWPEHRTVCEVDGAVKYADVRDPRGQRHPGNALFAEKVREDALREAGAEVVRGYWSDGRDRGAALCDRVRAAFARAAVRTDPVRYRVLPAAPGLGAA